MQLIQLTQRGAAVLSKSEQKSIKGGSEDGIIIVDTTIM